MDTDVIAPSTANKVQQAFGIPAQRDWEDVQIRRIDAAKYLDTLRARDRKILMLSYAGYSAEVIGRVVGMSTSGARKRLGVLRDDIMERRAA
jgi:DNA-directed RNA polymerase specialized sigma24 family protein